MKAKTRVKFSLTWSRHQNHQECWNWIQASRMGKHPTRCFLYVSKCSNGAPRRRTRASPQHWRSQCLCGPVARLCADKKAGGWWRQQHPHLCLWHFAALLRLGPAHGTHVTWVRKKYPRTWAGKSKLTEPSWRQTFHERQGTEVWFDQTTPKLSWLKVRGERSEKGCARILYILIKSCWKPRPWNPKKTWQNWHWKKGQNQHRQFPRIKNEPPWQQQRQHQHQQQKDGELVNLRKIPSQTGSHMAKL